MLKISLTIMALIYASPVYAQSYISDAFGLIETKEINNNEREHWAGIQELLQGTMPPKKRFNQPKALESLLPYVGPKSNVSNLDKTHAAVIAFDQEGNLVANQQVVEFALGFSKKTKTETKYGLADIVFMPDPNASYYHVGMSSSGKQSLRSEYRVVPDLSHIDLEILPQLAPALSETYVDIKTPILMDKNNNKIGNGVALQLMMKHNNGTTSLATGIAIKDSVHARILTRSMDKDAKIALSLGRNKSNVEPFSINQISIETKPIVIAKHMKEIDAVHLKIGQFISSAGHMINDGIPVEVSVEFFEQPRRIYQGWIRDGFFEGIISANSSPLPATIIVKLEQKTFHLHLDRYSSKLIKTNWIDN